MKVAAIILSSVTVNSDFLSRHAREGETEVSTSQFDEASKDADYPLAGKQFLATLGDTKRSGRGGASNGQRKIYARKRLINSQIATSDRSAWYYQYHDYGCYCVAPTDDKKSRGKPVDAIDSACKKHALCYACAFSDFSNAQQKTECNPKQTGYKYNIREGEEGKYHISCLNERDSCQYAACMCDKALAEELGKMVMNGQLADPQYRNYDGAKCSSQAQRELAAGSASSGRGDLAMSAGQSLEIPSFFHDDASGAMDFENEMQIMWQDDGTNDVSMKQCCGVYPQRFPYKQGRNHECCDVGKSTEELKPVGTC